MHKNQKHHFNWYCGHICYNPAHCIMKGEDYQTEENEMISLYNAAPVRKHFRRKNDQS
jgi:hypothetical protein